MSTDVKMLYGTLLDRMSLSVKNGWLNDQGRVFIIFTIEDVKRALYCIENAGIDLCSCCRTSIVVQHILHLKETNSIDK